MFSEYTIWRKVQLKPYIALSINYNVISMPYYYNYLFVRSGNFCRAVSEDCLIYFSIIYSYIPDTNMSGPLFTTQTTFNFINLLVINYMCMPLPKEHKYTLYIF